FSMPLIQARHTCVRPQRPRAKHQRQTAPSHQRGSCQRVPESRALQQVAAHAGFLERSEEVCISFDADLPIMFGGSLHFHCSEVNSLITASGRTSVTAAFTEAASSASAVTGSAPNSATTRDDCGERASANTE